MKSHNNHGQAETRKFQFVLQHPMECDSLPLFNDIVSRATKQNIEWAASSFSEFYKRIKPFSVFSWNSHRPETNKQIFCE